MLEKAIAFYICNLHLYSSSGTKCQKNGQSLEYIDPQIYFWQWEVQL